MIGARMLTISLLLGVASCSSGADPGLTSTAQPGPINSSTVVVTSLSTSPPQTTTQATGVATTTAPTSDPNAIVEVPLEDALREWRSVVISRELVIGEVVFDGETLIFSTEGIRYFAAQDGAQREIYQESGDWIVRQSMLVDGRLLLVESSEHGAESRVMSIDPTTGASEELVSLSGGPPPWSILSLTQRGEVVASQQEDGGGSCIERLGPGEPERLVCAADSSELVFFSDLDAGTLVLRRDRECPLVAMPHIAHAGGRWGRSDQPRGADLWSVHERIRRWCARLDRTAQRERLRKGPRVRRGCGRHGVRVGPRGCQLARDVQRCGIVGVGTAGTDRRSGDGRQGARSRSSTGP